MTVIEIDDMDCLNLARSNDGQLWQLAAAGKSCTSDTTIIETVLFESQPGCLHRMTRDTAGRLRLCDLHVNEQVGWEPQASVLPVRCDGFDVASLEDGSLAMVADCQWMSDRHLCRKLLLLHSTDHGKTWERGVILEKTSSATTLNQV
jgi:hypothetical protein